MALLVAAGFLSAVHLGLAEDSAVSYQLVNLEDGTVSHTLNVVIPQSLNEYYAELSHSELLAGDWTALS